MSFRPSDGFGEYEKANSLSLQLTPGLGESAALRGAPTGLRLSTPNPPSRGPSPAVSATNETPGNGQRTPTDHRPAQRRKTTLISLIDELTALRDEEMEKERVAHLMFDEKRDGRELFCVLIIRQFDRLLTASFSPMFSSR